jgi:hypothetical protein
MSEKGTNGQMDGRAKARAFRAWLRQVEDFKPFIRQGKLNISLVAAECGFKHREVFYTNPRISKHLLPALERRLEQEGVLHRRIANPVEVVQRAPRPSAASDARVKQIQEENGALKAENEELRKQLERFNGIEEVLNTTGRLPW